MGTIIIFIGAVVIALFLFRNPLLFISGALIGIAVFFLLLAGFVVPST